MRLTKLTTEQIARYWEYIRECLDAALPPYVRSSTESMTRIRQQLLLGSLECWIGSDDVDSLKLYGMMTTQIISDPISGTENLLIYSVTITNEHPHNMWEEAAIKLSQYAAAKNCYSIIAYSSNEHMIRIAERLGADSSYKLLTFKL